MTLTRQQLVRTDVKPCPQQWPLAVRGFEKPGIFPAPFLHLYKNSSSGHTHPSRGEKGHFFPYCNRCPVILSVLSSPLSFPTMSLPSLGVRGNTRSLWFQKGNNFYKAALDCWGQGGQEWTRTGLRGMSQASADRPPCGPSATPHLHQDVGHKSSPLAAGRRLGHTLAHHGLDKFNNRHEICGEGSCNYKSKYFTR